MKDQVREVWMRVVGLPLHLGTHEILRKRGESYGGFLAIHKFTSLRAEFTWARILVKFNGKERPSSLNILVGA